MDVLCQATKSVMEIQQCLKVNSDELKKQMTKLEYINEKIASETEKRSQIKKDIAALARKECIVFDEKTVKEARCKQMDLDIHKIEHENVEQNLKLSQLQRDVARERREIGEYKLKIVKSRTAALEYEDECFGNEEIAELTKRRESLRQESQAICDEVRAKEQNQNEVEEEIQTIERELEEASNEITLTKTKLEETKAKERSKKQRIVVLKKRNEALLTRLQRQVNAGRKTKNV